MKVLVVEDNPDIKELLDYILQDEGHEVVACADGSSVNVIDRILPDLILMDELLSGVRGSTLIKKLKANPASQHVPVILLSAMPNIQDIASECGADAWLEKPFNIDSLTEAVKNFA
ncbi:MAG TPA: response regulator [Mucilaginibacter sp.]|nr:response regulator [Mucilaginibacter sp.]